MNKQNKKSTKNWQFLTASLIMGLLAILMVGSVFAADTTRPTVTAIYPQNNAQEFTPNQDIRVTFSEDMNPSTINADTFTVFRRTTPASGAYRAEEISKVVMYNSNTRTATFMPNYDLSAGQVYGNVFTVTVTTGAKDLAGNSLGQDYIWSFTTGQDAFNTDSTTSQQTQITTLAGSTAPV
ncbi:MAG: Ig-like domain-containing protein, partial [Nanoarchaeota archaeon]